MALEGCKVFAMDNCTGPAVKYRLVQIHLFTIKFFICLSYFLKYSFVPIKITLRTDPPMGVVEGQPAAMEITEAVIFDHRFTEEEC